MDIPSAIWLSELEMDNLDLIHQRLMNPLQESFDSFVADSFTSESESYPANYPSFCTEILTNNYFQTGVPNSTEQLKTTSNATPKASSRSSSNIISFGNDKEDYSNDSLEFSERRVKASYSRRSASQTQDHVLNERKRRETMAKQFAALSDLIPTKRKMDKASVLGEATRYIKELKGRVEELEDEEERKDVESVVSVKRSRLFSDGDASSSEENSSSCHIHTSPGIEVRVSGASVLVKIHCRNHSGLIVKALNEIQKHRLSIISSNAMPFASSTLLINIIAQMDDEFFMEAKDLVKELQLAILTISM